MRKTMNTWSLDVEKTLSAPLDEQNRELLRTITELSAQGDRLITRTKAEENFGAAFIKRMIRQKRLKGSKMGGSVNSPMLFLLSDIYALARTEIQKRMHPFRETPII